MDAVLQAIALFARRTGLPVGVAAGIAALESGFKQSQITGSHYGLYQVKKSVWRDWARRASSSARRALTWAKAQRNPQDNAWVASFAFRRVLQKLPQALTPTQRAVLAYWSWLVGTADGPKAVRFAVSQGITDPEAIAKLPQIPGTVAQFWRSGKKAKYAKRIIPWLDVDWDDVVERVRRRLRRDSPVLVPKLPARKAAAGAVLAVLVALMLLSRR